MPVIIMSIFNVIWHSCFGTTPIKILELQQAAVMLAWAWMCSTVNGGIIKSPIKRGTMVTNILPNLWMKSNINNPITIAVCFSLHFSRLQFMQLNCQANIRSIVKWMSHHATVLSGKYQVRPTSELSGKYQVLILNCQVNIRSCHWIVRWISDYVTENVRWMSHHATK